jgi:uncharacterized protein
MNTPTIEEIKQLAQQIPEKIPYLKMLVLFGSRATGKVHANSDWDFAVLIDKEQEKIYAKDDDWGIFGLPSLIGEILHINPDNIDFVELNHCSWLIAHFVARDGILIFEKDTSGFEYFRLTSLRPESELKKYRKDKYQLIGMQLKQWSL